MFISLPNRKVAENISFYWYEPVLCLISFFLLYFKHCALNYHSSGSLYELSWMLINPASSLCEQQMCQMIVFQMCIKTTLNRPWRICKFKDVSGILILGLMNSFVVHFLKEKTSTHSRTTLLTLLEFTGKSQLRYLSWNLLYNSHMQCTVRDQPQ